MIKVLLALLLITPVFAMCPEETGTINELSTSVAGVFEKKACENKPDVNVADMALGCLSGGGKVVSRVIESFKRILKVLVVDAPGYLFKESKEMILKIINGDLNPIEMASAIASINLSSQTSLWDTAKNYYESFKKFAAELKNELISQVEDFPCLPLRKQSELVCGGVSSIFLVFFGPEKFIKGAKWTIETTIALKNFVAETKAVQGLGKLSIAERLEKASVALRETTARGAELLKLRNSTLSEVVLPNGEKILQYEQRVRGADGKFLVIKREVPLDAKTKAIDSNSAIGKEILGELINSKSGTGSLVFVDVNHLGKVNYFKGGTQGGDKYLESVADSLRKTLRPGDMVFKNGGDELVVVLGSNNPAVVKQVAQRMINEVDQNPEVRKIFRQEVADAAQRYREVNRARRLEDIPPEALKSLSSDELKAAQANFTRFQESKKKELLAQMQDQASYRGSVSVGATMVRHDEKVADVLTRAEQQAARVKAEYKARYGHDVSKYKIDAGEISVTGRGAPVALDPL
jgi:GGDEF domain-containing protein